MNNLTRNETGPVLTQAMHLFLGQTNLIDWGKANYAAGENGGISGIVFYSVTRAENDPRYGAAETWEPGIPRVQVCLYRDNLDNATGQPRVNGDGLIDDINGVTGVQLCDLDNYPFGWSDGTAAKGAEDVVRSGDGTTFNPGDAIQVAATDSWDDNNPSGCIQDRPVIRGNQVPECADGFGTWNQVRPGVFDGGYAFGARGRRPRAPRGHLHRRSGATSPLRNRQGRGQERRVRRGLDAQPAAAAAGLCRHGRKRAA